MRKVLLLFIAGLVTILSALIVDGAQAAPMPQNTPAITAFSTPVTVVDRAALENRRVRLPLSWQTTHRPITANLLFEQVLPDGSFINVELPRLFTWVASSGEGIAAPILPPGGAGEIVLRARLLDLLTQQVYSERQITLPVGYTGDPGSDLGAVPTITDFGAGADTVRLDQLQHNTARIRVHWNTINRPITANLVFEQVLPNGQIVNVELPRSNLWVNSSGNGVVAPQAPDESKIIWLRLRLVDMVNGRVYDQRDVPIDILDRAAAPHVRLFIPGVSSVQSGELQAGSARVPVSWTVDNRPANSNLVFEQVLPNGQIVNVELPRVNPIVPDSGTGTVAPVNPGGGVMQIFLLLRLVDLTNGAEYARRELIVPVTAPVPDPQITLFVSGTPGVSAADLQNGAARVALEWAVNQRPDHSNLVFEQRLPDGNLVNVELPRPNPLVSSTGGGTVIPVWPGGGQTSLALVLRLIDLRTGATLASRELTIPIVNAPGGAAGIESFEFSPAVVDLGGTVTLSWAVNGASTVRIQYVRPDNTFADTFENLPLSGSLNFTIPRESTTFAHFQMSAYDAQGRQMDVESRNVPIRCPYANTYAGCPMQQFNIQAAYQTFQNGAMFWRGDTGQIYVLYSDGTYQIYSDTWTADQPVDTGETAPDGLTLPARGFGKVWAQQPGVRDRLGWASGAEMSYGAKLEIYPVASLPDHLYANRPDGQVLIIGQQWGTQQLPP